MQCLKWSTIEVERLNLLFRLLHTSQGVSVLDLKSIVSQLSVGYGVHEYFIHVTGKQCITHGTKHKYATANNFKQIFDPK